MSTSTIKYNNRLDFWYRAQWKALTEILMKYRVNLPEELGHYIMAYCDNESIIQFRNLEEAQNYRQRSREAMATIPSG